MTSLAPALDRYATPVRVVSEDDLFRGTSRPADDRRPCACGTDVVLRSGEDLAWVIACHNHTIAHLAWRAQEDA